MNDAAAMAVLTAHLASKSSKMRALASAGYKTADIARFLDVRYQFVRNVLLAAQAREGVGPVDQSPAYAIDQNDGSGRRSGSASFRIRLTVGPNGVIVLPSELRAQLGLAAGGVLIAQAEEGGLRLVTPKAALQRAQDLVRRCVPKDVSLVDDLLRDRARDASGEDDDAPHGA